MQVQLSQTSAVVVRKLQTQAEISHELPKCGATSENKLTWKSLESREGTQVSPWSLQINEKAPGALIVEQEEEQEEQEQTNPPPENLSSKLSLAPHLGNSDQTNGVRASLPLVN